MISVFTGTYNTYEVRKLIEILDDAIEELSDKKIEYKALVYDLKLTSIYLKGHIN